MCILKQEKCPWCRQLVGLHEVRTFKRYNFHLKPGSTSEQCGGSMHPTRWTIGEIVAANKAAGGQFFSHSTKKFFRDHIRNWGVWHKEGRVFIHLKRGHCGAAAGQVREFDPVSGRISAPADSIISLMARYPEGYRREGGAA